MSEPLTDDELTELRAMYDRGRWSAIRPAAGYADAMLSTHCELAYAAVNALPRLLAEIDRLRARVAELESMRQHLVLIDEIAATSVAVMKHNADVFDGLPPQSPTARWVAAVNALRRATGAITADDIEAAVEAQRAEGGGK